MLPLLLLLLPHVLPATSCSAAHIMPSSDLKVGQCMGNCNGVVCACLHAYVCVTVFIYACLGAETQYSHIRPLWHQGPMKFWTRVGTQAVVHACMHAHTHAQTVLPTRGKGQTGGAGHAHKQCFPRVEGGNTVQRTWLPMWDFMLALPLAAGLPW